MQIFLQIGNVLQRPAQEVKEPIVKPNDFSSILETNSCKAKRCFTTTLQNNMFSIKLETLVLFSQLTYQAKSFFHKLYILSQTTFVRL